MKKYIAFLLCFIMMLSLISCNTENAIEATNPPDNSDKATAPSKQHYKIEKLDLTKVRYYIYDTNGNTVLSDETDRPLDISMLGDNIVDICIGMGTGISIHKYYDVQNNRFSEEYSYVAAASGNLVAYIDTSMEDPMINRVLVVRDIFDKNIFYKSFGLDFSPTVHDPIESASFSDGEAELDVVYLSERPPVPLSITLPIRHASGEGEILSHAERAMQAYEAALKNKIRVCETDIEEYNYLKDYKTPYNRIPLCELERLRYAYMDVDGDSINELVIDCGDTLILRYYEGTVYIYSFIFRNLYYLNTDGSYSWNHTGTDFEYGENQIYFEGSALKTREIWRIVNDGEPDAEYYIGDKQVTQEEILTYFENSSETRIEFLPLEVSWLNKISRYEAITIAENYWEDFDIKENGYRVELAVNANAPDSVYVMVIKRLVIDHYSTFDEIWIDKTSGEAIIPYEPDGKG